MNIVIPTYRRVDNQRTWQTIHPDLRQHITFVVRPDEADAIRERYAPSRVLVLPPEVQTGKATFQHALEAFWDRKFVFMEDDITRFYRTLRFFEPDSDRVRKQPFKAERVETAEGQETMFRTLLSVLDTPYTALCAPRAAYSGASTQLRESAQWCFQFIVMNGPLLRDIDARFDRVDHYYDLDLNMQCLDHGLDTVQCNDYYFTQLPPNSPGGCMAAMPERVSVREAEFERLAGLWPRAVRPGCPVRTKHMRQRGPAKPYMFTRVKFLKQRRQELGIQQPLWKPTAEPSAEILTRSTSGTAPSARTAAGAP